MARAFHWVMALSMFALLITAFLPKVGVKFDWVTYHWIAGLVLSASVIFHIFHASFCLDFWSIWPDKIDLRDAKRRMMRAFGKDAPPPGSLCKVSAGEQVLSLRDSVLGSGRHRHRPVHDEAREHVRNLLRAILMSSAI